MLELCADLVISCIKKSYFILLGRHIEFIKNRSTGRRIKMTRLEIYQVGMTEHTKQHQLQKTKTLYSWAKSVHGDWKKHGASKWSSETVTKNMDHTGSKEETKSMKFAKPKCSSCKQNEIRSHRKIIFLHTWAAQHHIHEKPKHSTTHHIQKTWNKSE